MPGLTSLQLGGQWAVPCDVSETITFTFGYEFAATSFLPFDSCHPSGQNYTLQPSEYLIGPTFGDPDLCLTWPRASPPSPDGIDWQIGSAAYRLHRITLTFLL